MADFGYDVSDYCAVHPQFGTLADLVNSLKIGFRQRADQRFERYKANDGRDLTELVKAIQNATIFDGGRIREQIAAQNAVQEQAVSSYESKILTALEEVENALVAFENNRQRLDSLNQAASAADNAFELARNQYSAGLIDFQRVLDTQRTALTVQDNIATTQGDRLTALVQLYKALGGGWTPENNVSTGKNTA